MIGSGISMSALTITILPHKCQSQIAAMMETAYTNGSFARHSTAVRTLSLCLGF